MQGADRFFSNQKMKLLCRDDHCSVYQMKNETGNGTGHLLSGVPWNFCSLQ